MGVSESIKKHVMGKSSIFKNSKLNKSLLNEIYLIGNLMFSYQQNKERK